MTRSYALPLRWVDLDAQGHVNNSLIVDYLQEARVRYFLESEATRTLTADGVVVVAHQVEYHSPVAFSLDPIMVEMAIDYVGGSKVGVAYELSYRGHPVASARTLLCAFDFVENSPRRLPVDARAALKAHARAASSLRDIGSYDVGERHHAHPLSVRWSDQDSYGHVNNVRFYDYIAEARIHMTTDADTSATRMSAGSEAGNLWLIARQDLDYLHQLSYRPEPYEVRTSVAKIGRTSVTLVADLCDPHDGTVFAHGQTVLVCADTAGAPTPLPESLVASLSAYQI